MESTMKLGGQSRKEATQPKILLTTRRSTRLGTWNVRTMYEAGKAQQIAAEMKEYHLDILGLCETRWTGTDKCPLASGETILYSGHLEENAPHTEGVGFMLSPRAQRALIEWKAEGPRLISAEFRTQRKEVRLQVIQAYAPTNDKDQEVKDNFYRKLQDTIDQARRKNVIIVMGDFNAKVGNNNRGFEEIMGKHGLGERSENGELFVDICAANDLVIGGTVFPHKRIHKATWVSPDQQTENQIDHICINKIFRRSLKDVRVYRGADVASDHHLLIGDIQLKLKKRQGMGSRRLRYNVELLKDQGTREEFNLVVKNKFQPLETLDEDHDVEETWQMIKTGWTRACEEVLGKRERHHKPWISAGTLKKIGERKRKKDILNRSKTRAAKAEAQVAYTRVAKEVKASIKEDKRNYVEDLAREAEEAAGAGNMRGLYENTKKLSGKYSNTDMPIKDKDGKLLTNEDEQNERWKEHFEGLLNRPRPEEQFDIPPAETDLGVSDEKPSMEEIKQAIKCLKSSKAAGPDGIPPEALKADVETTAGILHGIIGKIWDDEVFPLDWREGFLVKLPKKGDLQECKNYRGIMLLSIPGKVLSRVILERLKEAVDGRLRDEQAGFRPKRACTDQIATLRIIVEQSLEWNSSLYVNFVDYEKAFDSLDREALWKLMRHYGIPDKFVTLIKKMYEGMKCRVLLRGGQLTDPFEVKTGVRQGCLLSPFLFLLAVDWVVRQTTSGRRNGIQWTLFRQLEDLDFADDLALLSHSQNQMQQKTELLSSFSGGIGLRIHSGKTKVLRVNAANAPVTLQETPLEEVDSFTYLGSVINKVGGTDEDIKVRIQKARGAFAMLRNVWAAKELKMDTKLRIFKTNVRSVLLYGCETWRLTNTAARKLQSFTNRCLRIITGIKWFDHVTNTELWERTGQKPVKQIIQERRWKWIGHTLRRPASSITRQALSWNPQGKRKRGRPRATWRREVEAEMKRTGRSWLQLERDAQDRHLWRMIVDGLCSSGSGNG